MASKVNLIILIISTAFFSCLSKVEHKLVGRYIMYEIVLNDTSSEKKLNLTLELKKDKSFYLSHNNEIISGKWEAGDDGDMTWADLYIKGSAVQCRILGKNDERILILNSIYLIDSSINKLSFIRQ